MNSLAQAVSHILLVAAGGLFGMAVMHPRVQVKFEPRDVWVGVFWDRRKDGV